MVQKWLMNKDKFCITEGGDMAGNADTCWWGLPSINAADSSYPPLGYWRGYVWGPMIQLVYWGLQQYDHGGCWVVCGVWVGGGLIGVLLY